MLTRRSGIHSHDAYATPRVVPNEAGNRGRNKLTKRMNRLRDIAGDREWAHSQGWLQKSEREKPHSGKTNKGAILKGAFVRWAMQLLSVTVQRGIWNPEM